MVNELGELVITTPLPSMPIYFWNDPDEIKYRAAYFERFPGVWCHGDWVKFTDRGLCVITGRSDGTLNRGGVRLGTSEFYSALDNFPEIADSLVVHLEDISGGLGTLFLFVQLTDGALDGRLRAKITACLRDRLSPRHVPDEVLAVPAIPYNLTGKKLEVPVKRLLQGASRGAVVSDGAMRNPDSLDAFEHLAQHLASTTAVGPARPSPPPRRRKCVRNSCTGPGCWRRRCRAVRIDLLVVARRRAPAGGATRQHVEPVQGALSQPAHHGDFSPACSR